MKFISIILFSFLMVYAPVIQSNNVLQDKKQKHKSKNDKSEQEKKQQNVSLLIESKRAEIAGDMDKSELLLRQYIEKYPDDAVGFFELAGLFGSKREIEASEKMIKEAVKLDPENEWYQLYYAEISQLKGNLKESVSIYNNLLLKKPEKLDYYYQLAALYLMQEDYDEAVEVYDRIENIIGITEEISIQKQKIFLQINNLSKAREELEKLSVAFPENTKYMALLAEFYLASDKQDKALEMYKKISITNPGDPYIYLSMADYYRKTGDRQKAFDNLKLGFSNPNLNLDTKINVLITFFSVKDMYEDQQKKAVELVKILVEVHPEDPKALSFYGDLLSQDKQYGLAREQFQKAVTLDSSKYVIWEEILRLDVMTENYDTLKENAKKVIELFPEQPLPYLFAGLANFQLKNYEAAIADFTRGSKQVVNNNELIAQFYMYLGDTYHSMKNEEESDKYYQKSLDMNSNNAYVLNNYAYYLSVRNQDLEKAEVMAKKAIFLDPENASFQDTYGWVLFKLGKYDEARTWISKALEEKDGPSAEVLEHYGDVLYKMGNVEEALQYWLKAKNKGEGSKYLDQKIGEKKLIE